MLFVCRSCFKTSIQHRLVLQIQQVKTGSPVLPRNSQDRRPRFFRRLQGSAVLSSSEARSWKGAITATYTTPLLFFRKQENFWESIENSTFPITLCTGKELTSRPAI